MNTSPAENPVPGVVTFTARGNAALDQLADALVAACDGSPASIADLLGRVLEADIEDLAETLGEVAQPDTHLSGRAVGEVGPAVEGPDEAARRRLGARMPGAAGAPQTRTIDVGR
ncbi:MULTISPECIES: hypothetical protein [Nocardioides]|jgi:hypothetical protein|uniref:Uncharacterized protein n=2 Tax=Nocardioides TaxID=1839 RepID=A0A316TMY3_9ACTN|nr:MULTISPECIES: hypothetical protein [Nocardioides]PWN04385.1 hypothetical protein DJ010_01715 [Nocardioides silvaticus]